MEEVDELKKEELVNKIGAKDFNNILEDIGLGNRQAYLTARQLIDTKDESDSDIAIGNKDEPLVIAGTEGMMVNFAKMLLSYTR